MIAFMSGKHSFSLKFLHFNIQEYKVKFSSLFYMIIKKPDNCKAGGCFACTTSLNQEGSLYPISRKSKPAHREATKKGIKNLKSMLYEKKVCVLADKTHSWEFPHEQWYDAARETPKFFTASLTVSESAAGKMPVNLLFRLKTLPYPAKMFNTGADAR
ncbi:MAG TPA: hypothetical protein PL029_08345, partial [Bacteroidia bacterium]|nr:hypothetical protein [Bacteroidia bacterium]